MYRSMMSLLVAAARACTGCEPPPETDADPPLQAPADASTGAGACGCEPGAQGPAGEDGRSGERGPQGERGDDGAPGADGAPGLAGEPGAAGPQGPAGPAGPQGSTGPQGSPGGQGPAGAQGPRGEQGEAGPQGERGLDGGPFSRDDVYPDSREVEVAPSSLGVVDVFCDSGDTLVSGSCDQGDVPMAGPGLEYHRNRPVVGASHGWTCTAWNPNGGVRKLHVSVLCHTASP